VAGSQNGGLTDRYFAPIARALAEPRRVRILKDDGTHKDRNPFATLYRMRRITAATFSHHIKELHTAG
jgi:ArsR family transcriptional regulator